MRRLLAAVAVTGGLVAAPLVSATPAYAAAAQPVHAMIGGGSAAGNRALNWATSHAYGHWYVWAGTGPGYDCSGLVMIAFAHAGVSLPHSTYAMLANPHLHRVSAPQRGDLAFYGAGHVEFVTAWWHQTFGAHDSGQRIGWIGWWGGGPTAFYRVY